MCNEYNGWSNYETWVVNLWLGNEESTDSDMRSLAVDSVEEAQENPRGKWGVYERDRTPVYYLEEKIKEYVEEFNPLASDASMFSDLLSGALSVVDWREIAEGYLEDLEEYQDYLKLEDEEETEES